MTASILPSGAVQCQAPHIHIFCGHCSASFLLCQCEGLSTGKDYVLKNLPSPPDPNATTSTTTPAQLIQRWCSLIPMSRSMGVVNTKGWYEDNAQRLVVALQIKSQLMKEMVDDYVHQLGTDRTLTALAGILGGPSLVAKSQATQIQAVTEEAQASLAIFLSGDWSCLTYVGNSMLNNAFQLSDPQKYNVNDAQLGVIYALGIGFLSDVFGLAYSDNGRHLAMEMNRRPCITANAATSPILESATERLFKYGELTDSQ